MGKQSLGNINYIFFKVNEFLVKYGERCQLISLQKSLCFSSNVSQPSEMRPARREDRPVDDVSTMSGHNNILYLPQFKKKVCGAVRCACPESTGRVMQHASVAAPRVFAVRVRSVFATTHLAANVTRHNNGRLAESLCRAVGILRGFSEKSVLVRLPSLDKRRSK